MSVTAVLAFGGSPPAAAPAPARYVLQRRLAAGTFGVVYTGEDRAVSPPRAIAVKCFHYGSDGDGVSRDVLQEVTVMRSMPPHPNVVRLLDVVDGAVHVPFKSSGGDGGGGAALIYELMHTDLGAYVRSRPTPMPHALLRSYAYQLLRALAHCHAHGVVHRDVKPQNVLIDDGGRLTLADFGCARIIFGTTPLSSTRPLTPVVCSLWYRAPEVLLSATQYGAPMDVWAAGCVVAEMFSASPLLPGHNEPDQLMRICALLGRPPVPPSRAAHRAAIGAAFLEALIAKTPTPTPRALTGNRRVDVDADADAQLDALLCGMLDVDAERRWTAERCMAHAYFDTIRAEVERVLPADA